jgi:peptide/nickel transport system ATP-binding protein/oligopeptide transport system ATP-binding protein
MSQTNGKKPTALDGTTAEDLLRVDNLVKHYPIRGGLLQRTIAQVKAVDGISFNVKKGETLGLVGESGCGKTTVGRTLLRLIPATGGKVYFDGKDIFSLNGNEMKAMRKDMQIIFQDPYSSLDPRMPIGESVGEGLLVHGMRDTKKRNDMVMEMLKRVGLEDYHAKRYPHEFSGGQRQRIGIARALALRPRFIVCDEPVSALDVSIQAQVLNLLKDLQKDFGLTYLFIAHNLAVVEHISDRVGVMYVGKMVELTDRDSLFADPLHPYTKALLSAIPMPDPTLKRERMILQGDVPSPVNPPKGCRFHPRCPFAVDKCKVEDPPLKELKPGHFAACWVAEDQIKMAM